eukprot:5828248-Prymnesium_polylepis.1
MCRLVTNVSTSVTRFPPSAWSWIRGICFTLVDPTRRCGTGVGSDALGLVGCDADGDRVVSGVVGSP